MWREAGRSAGRGIGQGGGILLVVLIIAVTVGTWLAWDLICRGPGLLADTIIDGVLIPERPEMAMRMSCEPWQKNMVSSTFFHFAGMALMASVAAAFLPPVFPFAH
jgi:hypothetical protein